MSLQRGTYGLEFDDRQGSPVRKLWLPVVLILLVAAGLLFYRGCRGDEQAPLKDDNLGATRYRLPEASTARERPSLLRHFLNFSRRDEKSEAAGTPAPNGGVTARGNDAQNANAEGQPPFAVGKVQSPEVRKLLEQATAFETADDWVNARLVLQQVLLRRDAEDVRAFAERKIGSLNTALVFGDRPMPEKTRYRIAAGDLIGKLAKRFGNTQAYLLKANGIDKPQLLRIGREIWVLQAPVFELTVFKRAGTAVLALNGQFFKRYEIGLGKSSNVPAGTYTVRNRVTDPTFRLPDGTTVDADDPQNILGSRWVSLTATGATPETTGLGLHGTRNPAALGRPSAEGRVRFRNADIEELCTLIPDGTAVNIVE